MSLCQFCYRPSKGRILLVVAESRKVSDGFDVVSDTVDSSEVLASLCDSCSKTVEQRLGSIIDAIKMEVSGGV